MNNPILWAFIPLTLLALGLYAHLWRQDWGRVNSAADERTLPEAPGPWLKLLNGGFVSLGLLFTFIGISRSISQLGGAFKTGTDEALNAVMGPLGAKFYTSIIGLVAYLVTASLNTRLANRRSTRLAAFHREEEAAQEQAREAAAVQARAQAEAAALGQRKLFEAIAALQDTFRFDAANPGPIQNMAMDLSRRLSEDLGAKLGEILTNTDAFAQVQAQTRELMKSIQATTASLDEATRGMAEQSPRLIQQMNDASCQMNEAITRASAGLETAASTAAGDIGASMAQFSSATRESIQAFGATVSTQIEASVSAAVGQELAQTIRHQLQVGQDLQAAMLRRVDQGNDRLAGTLTTLREGLDQTLDGLNTSVQELEDQVGACSRDLSQHMARSADGLNQGVDRGLEHLTSALTGMLEEAGRNTRAHAQTLQAAAVEVRNQADLVRAGVGETLQAQQEVKEDITGLARTAAIFEACTADIRTAFEANQGHLESQGEAVRAIRMEVDQLGPLGQAQARQLDQMQQEFALAAQEQVTGLERLDAGIQGVTSEVREQARLVQGMQDGQEQTSRQVKQVVESTEFLKVELGTIQRLTHALSERVEHVFKALGDLASRLADNLFGRRAPEPEPEPVTDDEPAGVP